MGQTLWCLWFIHAICAVNALFGAVPLVGRALTCLYQGPPKRFFRGAGRPMGPSTPPCSSQNCVVFVLLFCLNPQRVICLKGLLLWAVLSGLVSPFTLSAALLSLWFGFCVRRRRCSLLSLLFFISSLSFSLSLSIYISGVGERQTTWWFVFPLVFLHPGHGLPRHLFAFLITYSKLPLRRNLFLAVFWFLRVDDVGVFCRSQVVFFVCAISLCLSFSLSLFLFVSTACVEVTLRLKRGKATIMARPFIIDMAFVLLLGRDTAARAVYAPSRPCSPPTSLRSGEVGVGMSRS